MENVIVCGSGTVFYNNTYFGETKSSVIVINNVPQNTDMYVSICDDSIGLAVKPSKHKKGKKLKCWDSKRFYE
ncbi:hypothetical protein LGL08_20075 [Clostridium estertheticum]|uniref:hypothetical protein n=1 Tax=Clostridium estertheticum TaxID=238834 RepID=UPI001CF2C5D7|nr:hypothetical protein [Clostridium estertheticum]MCB2309003.1 hypothetical protein [Clostridium estertheticum]MCB2346863.1 hypothetical protein [Clostridium estertheticum]MCB2351825.1 hypothetical protein [Clostridium estertheticum]WAG48429.1 hypothetical protein LL127_22880 [Clostridium estertheticum]